MHVNVAVAKHLLVRGSAIGSVVGSVMLGILAHAGEWQVITAQFSWYLCLVTLVQRSLLPHCNHSSLSHQKRFGVQSLRALQ
jgi:hypothetical protein